MSATREGTRLPIQIRKATPDDAPALVPLFEEIGFPSPAETIAARIESMSGGEEILLVAVKEDAPLGVLAVHLTPLLHRPEPVGRLTLLVVAESVRGQGLGRALVEAAEDELVRRGCTIAEVISNRRYAASHGFYEQLGYELTSYKFKKFLPSAR